MKNKVYIPPIKSQGIKTKLIDGINNLVLSSGVALNANWYEPFFGTGVVGFNSPLKGQFFVGDTNPHIIRFYTDLQNRIINKYSMREYLEDAGERLASAAENGYAYYREVKNRFNKEFSPLDFIFLSRAGFNGMMRFNKKGEWNIPFCKKSNRFAPAYITKICNQVDAIQKIILSKSWTFYNISFEKIIEMAGEGDIIYCDPPYFGRYVDYYNGWTEGDEKRLFNLLSNTKAKFILSTWHHNAYRENEMIAKYWDRFNIQTKDHFYHSGGKVENRRSIVEALVYNFQPVKIAKESIQERVELTLF